MQKYGAKRGYQNHQGADFKLTNRHRFSITAAVAVLLIRQFEHRAILPLRMP
jgi:hypothetical protein